MNTSHVGPTGEPGTLNVEMDQHNGDHQGSPTLGDLAYVWGGWWFPPVSLRPLCNLLPGLPCWPENAAQCELFLEVHLPSPCVTLLGNVGF